MLRGLVSRWRSHFGGSRPAAFLLREEIPNRWVRIHSLLESRKYADSDAEFHELESRHSEVAGRMLKSASCYLFWFHFGAEPDRSSEATLKTYFELDLVRIRDFDLDADDDCDSLRFQVAPFPFSAHKIKKLVLGINDELVSNILIADLERFTVYAPYTGGADLFFPSAEEASSAKVRWKQWLSGRSDSL